MERLSCVNIEPLAPGSTARFAPDGLAGTALDELIDRAYVEVAGATQATSALVDRSAAERRRRRIERRTVTALVRALPGRRAISRVDGRAA
jgi:hypothetical protein